MKYLILYLLKDRHEKLLDDFHVSKYLANEDTQYELWKKVVKCRNKIRSLEPDFLKGCD